MGLLFMSEYCSCFQFHLYSSIITVLLVKHSYINVEEILKLRNIFSTWVTIHIDVYLVVLPRNSEQSLDLQQFIWVGQNNSHLLLPKWTLTQEYEGTPNLMNSHCNFKWLDEQLILMKSRLQAMSLQRPAESLVPKEWCWIWRMTGWLMC